LEKAITSCSLTSFSYNTSSRLRPQEGSAGAPVSPSSLSKFTSFSRSWMMQFPEFPQEFTYGWLWSCLLLTWHQLTTVKTSNLAIQSSVQIYHFHVLQFCCDVYRNTVLKLNLTKTSIGTVPSYKLPCLFADAGR
jgi:hypothetical protein